MATFPDILPTDTPIKRTWITQLSDEDLHNYIASLQERRLATQREYELGMKAKEEKATGAKLVLFEKNLAKMQKLNEKITKDLTALEKVAVEVQALRLVLEHT